MDAEIIVVMVVLGAVVLILIALSQYVIQKVSLVSEITEHTGLEVASSGGYGRADINGMSFKNSIKVIHYKHGYVLKLFPIWGGGKLWMPKKELSIIE
jgi:hypothetical protein